MAKKGGESICISLGEEFLKIAQVKGSGISAKITGVVTEDIRGISDEALPKVIQKALSGFKSKSADICCIVPSGMATTKNIEVPSVSPEEIKSIVSLQAGRHTPFSREEIQTGFVNIGVYKSNFTKVLLVIANKNLLKRQIGIFEKAGLKIRKVLFSPEGSALFYSDALGLAGESSPTGVIDIGKTSTDFIIVFKGLPITSRCIPVGSDQITSEGQSAKDKLVDELKKTLDGYKSEDIEQVPHNYLFTSGDAVTQDLQTYIKDKIGWDIQLVPYVDHIKAVDSVLSKIGSEYSGSSFLDVVAVAATFDKSQVNLVPEELQLQKSIEVQGKEVLKVGIYVFLILLIVAANIGAQIFFKKSYLNHMLDQYKDTRAEVSQLEIQRSRAHIIQNFLNTRMASLDLIYELQRDIPKEIYLTNIFMDENGTISIQGISEVGSLVYNLNSNLKERELFKSADVVSKTAKKDRGKDAHAFEISLKLATAADDEPIDGVVPETGGE